jgi:hypothetical protein
MARDALEENGGSFPNWPRRPDGSPDPARMPTGSHRQKTRSGKVVIVDVTPRHPVDDPLGRAGQPIIPPTLPPD